MPITTATQLYSPFHPPVAPPMRGAFRTQLDGRPGPKPPRQPDWLLVLIGIFFLIVLVIIWFVDIPTLFR